MNLKKKVPVNSTVNCNCVAAEWPRSSDLGVDNKEKTSSKKTVKIKEEHGLDDVI